MEVMGDYNQIKVKEIPENWNAESLENMSGFITKGSTPTTYGYEWEQSGILFLRSECVSEKGLDLTQSMFISPAAHASLRRSEVCDGDILVTITGNVGRIVYLSGVGCANLNQHIARVRINSIKVDRRYIYHFLSQTSIRRKFNTITTGQAYPQISLKQVRETIIILPPTKTEQTVIADALCDVDELIESLEQLITKNHQLKQGAMQELLSGKRRLAGFSGNWKIKALSDLIKIPVTDGPHITPKFLSDGIPFLSVNNLVNNKIDLTDLRYISKEDHLLFSKKCKPQKNDLLLGKAASVGRVAIVNLDMDFNIWSPIALIRINNHSIPEFIYYCIQSQSILKQIELLTNSSSQGNIGMGDIEKLMFLIPDKQEQIAIANILLDMDSEISALEMKLAKTKSLKQGMVRELFTGRIRLL